MANDTEINIGGTWKSIDNCEVNIGGTWKSVSTIEVNIGGTWKEVWAALAYALSGATIGDTNIGDATAMLRVNSDGTTDKQEGTGAAWTPINATTDWVQPNSYSSNDHWVRFEYVSGDSVGFTGTLNSWLQVSGVGGANQSMGWSSVALDRSGVYSVQIATDSGGSNVVAGPTNYTLTANGGS